MFGNSSWGEADAVLLLVGLVRCNAWPISRWNSIGHSSVFVVRLNGLEGGVQRYDLRFAIQHGFFLRSIEVVLHSARLGRISMC